MVGSRYRSGNRARRPSLVAVAVVVLLGGRAYAQTGGNAFTAETVEGRPRVLLSIPRADNRRLLADLIDLDDGAALARNGTQVRTAPASPGRRYRSLSRKVVGGAIGAFAGFLGGGFLGAKLEGPCHCDDPGLQGFIIGAPIGAVIGGILGAKFF